MNESNTIWAKAYTPAGVQVGITIAIENGQLKPAIELDNMIANAGYLVTPPGVEQGEDIEIMSHVSRRMHTSKKDGTVTPVIAFYHENTALNWKYDHMYMNTPEQIAAFEQVTGLTLLNIPEWEASSFLDRSDAKASKYIVTTTKPIKVAVREGTYKAQDGTTKTTMKIQRLLEIEAVDTTAKTCWLKDEAQLTIVKEGLATLGLDFTDDNIAAARKTVIAGAFSTPLEYLQALESKLKTIANGGIPF